MVARSAARIGIVLLLGLGWRNAEASGAVGTLADSSGEVVAWGDNYYGQSTVPSASFTVVAAGFQHSLAIRSDATLAAWGNNSEGQTTVPSGTFTAVAAGNRNSLAIRSDGTLAAWGNNAGGQNDVPSGSFTAVAAGFDDSLGLRSDGTLAGWGNNGDGQVTVPSGSFTAVAAGDIHSLGIRSDGTLAGWGDNSAGETTVPSGTFTAVAAGFDDSLGLRSDGTLAGWGNNSDGQVTVPSGTFTAVAAGYRHSLAIRSDGTLAAWGFNGGGETDVPSGTFTAIAAGGYHSLALRARTEYDGDLLIYGTGMTANLNRSINVAGNLTAQSEIAFYNNPTVTISGKLIVAAGAANTLQASSITVGGLELHDWLGIDHSAVFASSGPLTGEGTFSVLNNAAATVGMAPASLYSGYIELYESSSLTFTGQGYQTAASLQSGGAFLNPPFVSLVTGGELRLGPGQHLRFTSTGPSPYSSSYYPSTNYNGGRIEVLGGAGAGPSQIEFDGELTNGMGASPGWITGHDAVLRFNGGLKNLGNVSFTSGTNDVYGDVTNQQSGLILVTGGAGATFYDDVVQNGSFRVSKIGSTTSTAVFLGSFTGSGGSTGGGDIFFEGDLNPGNSPATVTMANNVVLGSGSSLNIELGGTTPGTQYDQVHVTGDLSLDGTLAVSLIDGFTPAPGNSFDILDWGTLSGAFNAFQLPALSSGLMWNTSRLYTSGVLSIGLPGDYNNDGTVDAADYILWRKNEGAPAGTLVNDPNPGTIGQAQYDTWRANFGATAGSGSGALANVAVPEPASIVLLIMGTLELCSDDVRRCHKLVRA